VPPDPIWQAQGFLVVEVDGPPPDLADAYQNPAAEGQRQIHLHWPTPSGRWSEPPLREGFGRLFGLKMFEVRLRAKVEESRRASSPGPR